MLPEKVCSGILDTSVKISWIMNFFDTDAWALVEEIIKCKTVVNTFHCACCSEMINDSMEELDPR